MKQAIHNTDIDLFISHLEWAIKTWDWLLVSHGQFPYLAIGARPTGNFHQLPRPIGEKSTLAACDNQHARRPTQFPRCKPTVDFMELIQRLYFHVTDAPSYLDAN